MKQEVKEILVKGRREPVISFRIKGLSHGTMKIQTTIS